MQSFYGLNLVDMLRDGSSYDPSTILVLVRALPLDSRTVATLRGGDEFIGWGVDRYLTAQLIDAVNGVAFVVAASNSKRKPKAPKPTPRPKKNAKETNPFRQRLDAAKKAKGG